MNTLKIFNELDLFFYGDLDNGNGNIVIKFNHSTNKFSRSEKYAWPSIHYTAASSHKIDNFIITVHSSRHTATTVGHLELREFTDKSTTVGRERHRDMKIVHSHALANMRNSDAQIHNLEIRSSGDLILVNTWGNSTFWVLRLDRANKKLQLYNL